MYEYGVDTEILTLSPLFFINDFMLQTYYFLCTYYNIEIIRLYLEPSSKTQWRHHCKSRY